MDIFFVLLWKTHRSMMMMQRGVVPGGIVRLLKPSDVIFPEQFQQKNVDIDSYVCYNWIDR